MGLTELGLAYAGLALVPSVLQSLEHRPGVCRALILPAVCLCGYTPALVSGV